MCDRKDFFKDVIYNPITQLGKNLACVSVEPPLETLKQVRLLAEIVMIIVTKTGYLRNRFVFTVQIVDNLDLVNLIGCFCIGVQTEQYASLLERYSKSPKACKLNLQIYTIICRVLTLIIGLLVETYRFPKNETASCSIFQSTLPAFLNFMTEQLNTFVVTRASEIHKFQEQQSLVYHFLVFFRSVMVQSHDERLSELFHTYSTGFLPQTVFFLAQHTAILGQDKSD